jgi:hypothetical protein
VIAGVCSLYPIALHAGSLADAIPGDVLADILNSPGGNSYGWLTWAGDNSNSALIASLTPPGDSYTYINPRDPADTLLNAGDWVRGRPGLATSRGVPTALDILTSHVIVVPVWDLSAGSGAAHQYRIAEFARVQILGYDLTRAVIAARYFGPASCHE